MEKFLIKILNIIVFKIKKRKVVAQMFCNETCYDKFRTIRYIIRNNEYYKYLENYVDIIKYSPELEILYP